MSTYKSRWLLAGFLCLALWPASAYGQSAALMDAHQRSNDLYAQGRYRKALGSKHPKLGNVLDNYAALKHATGHPQDAAIMASRAKVIRSKHLQDNPIR